MKRPILSLTVLLAAQLLLAGGLALATVKRRGVPADAPLLAFDKAAADRVVVEGPAGAKVELVKADGGWKVASRGGFPADAAKVERLLDRLAALRRAEPVATSAEAAARFKVADADFERRVTVEASGKPVATALFGTSAAMRSVHARVAGSGDVQLAELSTWEAPAAPDEWLDKAVLRIPRGEIEAVIVGGVTLEKSAPAAETTPASSAASAAGGAPAAPTWRATGLPKGASLDPAAAEALVTAVADLSISGVAESQPASVPDTLVVAVRRTGGATVEHRLAKPAAGADWTLRTSARPETLRVAAYAAEALQRAADPGTLSGKPPPAPGAPAAKPPAPAATGRRSAAQPR